MINAHIEQSSVYWAQHEKKLYKFRILELSEPFCEGRNGDTVLSRSCDNVTQKLRQLEKRNKRCSEPAVITQTIPLRARNRREKRTQSLPIDLQQLFAGDFSPENFKKNHVKQTLPSPVRRNGYKKDFAGPEISITVPEHEIEEQSNGLGSQSFIKTNQKLDEMATDTHCAEIKSSLRNLSSRYDEANLETKSKEELISIILELQDALRLSSED